MLARCSMCGRVADSDHPEKEGFETLPFFQPPKEYCRCGYAEIAHTDAVRYPIRDHKYEPVLQEMGTYYCGCRGWE